jgi:putative Ca2+/H+ antiporter (TMEM165/GDT1 family)
LRRATARRSPSPPASQSPPSAPAGLERRRLGVFLLTVITFFIAEMGDKTQLATIALGAKYQAFAVVVVGTTVCGRAIERSSGVPR